MEKNIRVAHIIGKWVGGGVESVVINYYRNIDRSKIQFDFICDSDSIDIPYDEITALGGEVILIPPYQKPIRYHFAIKKLLKEKKYKIVHAHITTMSVFPLFAAFCAKVPIRIAHAHSVTNKKERKKNLMKQILRPFSKLFATDYFCCSAYAGRWLFGHSTYDAGRVYLLNNAISVEKFLYNEELRKKMRKQLNIKEDCFVVGHIGRFVSTKNHHLLLQIFKEIYEKNKNSLLLLVGQGPLMEDVKKQVNQVGLTDVVYFLGQRKDVASLYQVFDVFLLPSLYEGLPVVGVEAQTSGLLCFFSDEMTREAKILSSTKFFSLSTSPKELASEILKKYRTYERKSCEQDIINNHYNIKTEANLLLEKYNTLLRKCDK